MQTQHIKYRVKMSICQYLFKYFVNNLWNIEFITVIFQFYSFSLHYPLIFSNISQHLDFQKQNNICVIFPQFYVPKQSKKGLFFPAFCFPATRQKWQRSAPKNADTQTRKNSLRFCGGCHSLFYPTFSTLQEAKILYSEACWKTAVDFWRRLFSFSWPAWTPR